LTVVPPHHSMSSLSGACFFLNLPCRKPLFKGYLFLFLSPPSNGLHASALPLCHHYTRLPISPLSCPPQTHTCPVTRMKRCHNLHHLDMTSQPQPQIGLSQSWLTIFPSSTPSSMQLSLRLSPPFPLPLQVHPLLLFL
jgi:hypothetical protein